MQELALLIRAANAGAVLVNTCGMFPAVDAAARAGVPSVWAIHESYEPAVFCHTLAGTAGLPPYVRSRFEACFQLPRALVFVARQTAELFAGISRPERRFVVDYGVNVADIDAYRAGTDRARLRAEAGLDVDDLVILAVGTFEPRKAQAALVAAFDELAVVHDRVRLVLIGAHPSAYTEAVRSYAARCRAGDRVRLQPVTADIHRWYALADVFVCASDIESLPRSILEAMAFELPVVSTDAFGIADLLDDGRTGWLTRPRDLEGLVGLLHLVLRLPEAERHAVGKQGRDEVVRRNRDHSYGQVFARALSGLLADPRADLAGVLARKGEELMTR